MKLLKGRIKYFLLAILTIVGTIAIIYFINNNLNKKNVSDSDNNIETEKVAKREIEVIQGQELDKSYETEIDYKNVYKNEVHLKRYSYNDCNYKKFTFRDIETINQFDEDVNEYWDADTWGWSLCLLHRNVASDNTSRLSTQGFKLSEDRKTIEIELLGMYPGDVELVLYASIGSTAYTRVILGRIIVHVTDEQEASFTTKNLGTYEGLKSTIGIKYRDIGENYRVSIVRK